MINNRQAGRRRGRGGQQQRSQGGNPGRPDNGNRIDNRARGNAAQLLEKYKTLARDAQMQGDRVNVEYYLQFADHYFRVLAETRMRHEENGGAPMRRIQGATLDEDEQDYEDEGERGGPQDQQRAPEQGQRDRDERSDGRTDGRGGERGSQNGSGYAGNGQQREPYAGQRDSQRDGPQRDGQRDAPRDGRETPRDSQREDRPRGRVNGNTNGGGDTNGNGNGNGNGSGGGGDYRQADTARAIASDRDDHARPAAREIERDEPRQPIRAPQDEAPQDTDVRRDESVQATPEPPRRGRGRPRREVAVQAEPAFEPEDRLPAMILPPALTVGASVSDEDGEAATEEKPRRRRGRPPANAAPRE